MFYRSRLCVYNRTKVFFSIRDSIIEFFRQEPLISFVPDESIRDLSGSNHETTYETYNPSPKPVGILTFDNIFLETNIAQGMIFKSEVSEKIQIFTRDVDPRYRNIEG